MKKWNENVRLPAQRLSAAEINRKTAAGCYADVQQLRWGEQPVSGDK